MIRKYLLFKSGIPSSKCYTTFEDKFYGIDGYNTCSDDDQTLTHNNSDDVLMILILDRKKDTCSLKLAGGSGNIETTIKRIEKNKFNLKNLK